MSARIRSANSESAEDGEVSDDGAATFDSEVSRRFEKRGGDLWTEVLEAESLEEGLRGIDPTREVSARDVKSFNRGAESYSYKLKDKESGLPTGFEKSDEDNRKRINEPTDADDLFGDSGLGDVAEFGVSTSQRPAARQHANLPIHAERESEMTPRHQKRFQRLQRLRNSQNFGESKNVDRSSTNRKRPFNEHAMETVDAVESVDASSNSRSHVRAVSRTSSTSDGRRTYGKRRKRGPHNFMDVVLRPGFSFETLYAAQIPDDFSVSETAEEIGMLLGEVDLIPITFAVTVIGKSQAIKVLEKTIETEKAGGLKIKTGQRRRTPGGVFFELLRQSEDLSEVVKNQINEFSKKHSREKAENEKWTSSNQDDEFPDASDRLLDAIPDSEAGTSIVKRF